MTCITLCVLPVLWFIINVNGNATSKRMPAFSTDICGKTRFSSSRIIGGETAELGEFPWMARIGLTGESDILFFCAGAIITSHFVATAAHCQQRQGNIVRVGENYLNSNRDCDKGVCAPPHQDIRISKFIAHENYCPTTLVNDFAMIQLASEVNYNAFVKPICFPSRRLDRSDLESKPLTVIGWGLVKLIPEKWTDTLRFMVIPSKNKLTCELTYLTKLEENQICLGEVLGKDVCKGDSGAPAFHLMSTSDGDTRIYLRGISSYGFLVCGLAPGVYTDVSYFAEWTRKIIHNFFLTEVHDWKKNIKSKPFQ